MSARFLFINQVRISYSLKNEKIFFPRYFFAHYFCHAFCLYRLLFGGYYNKSCFLSLKISVDAALYGFCQKCRHGF